MAPTSESWDCEMDIVSKVIRIVQLALSCSSGNSSQPKDMELDERETNFAKKFLTILISQNESFSSSFDDGGLGSSGISTSSILNSTSVGSIPVLVENPGRGNNANAKHRLQNLEMIKVGVLIFVISIIMLTTCRMIFQLFVRFRPEKP